MRLAVAGCGVLVGGLLAFTGLPAGVHTLTGLGLVSGGALAMRKADSQ